MRKRFFFGFTLLELMVVIIIIGILATVATPTYFKLVERAKASEAISMLGTIRRAMVGTAQGKGAYPTLIDELDIEVPNGTNFNFSILNSPVPDPFDNVNDKLVRALRTGPSPSGTYYVDIYENGSISSNNTDINLTF